MLRAHNPTHIQKLLIIQVFAFRFFEHIGGAVFVYEAAATRVTGLATCFCFSLSKLVRWVWMQFVNSLTTLTQLSG